MEMVFLVYFILHIPAFVMLFIGLGLRLENPERSKILLILAGAYFLIGGGICGFIMNGLNHLH